MEISRKAALAAGKFIDSNLDAIDADDIQSKGKNDFVTFVDKEAEKIITEIIKQQFPDHQILAEESGLDRQKSRYLWVIDPLDGTDNFIQGIGHYCVSIALLEDQNPIFGLIYDPGRQEFFYAYSGKGSYLNGRPIRLEKPVELKSAFGATAFPFRFHDAVDTYLKALKDILLQVRDIRRFGSAALDLAYTACGRYDFFWEAYLQPWDFMAGLVIIQEAGGKISNFQGKALSLQPDSVLAANPAIYDEIFKIIRLYF
jgi:myo-inositol-1(or 4)-monophosphatase